MASRARIANTVAPLPRPLNSRGTPCWSMASSSSPWPAITRSLALRSRRRTIAVHAGTGSERCVNGLHAAAAFAQPSGVVKRWAPPVHRRFRSEQHPPGRHRERWQHHHPGWQRGPLGFGLKDGSARRRASSIRSAWCSLWQRRDAAAVSPTPTTTCCAASIRSPARSETLAGTGKAELGTAEKIGFFEPNGVSADAEPSMSPTPTTTVSWCSVRRHGGPCAGHRPARAHGSGRPAGCFACHHHPRPGGPMTPPRRTTIPADLAQVRRHHQGMRPSSARPSSTGMARLRRRRADGAREESHRPRCRACGEVPYVDRRLYHRDAGERLQPGELTEAVHVAAAITGGAVLAHGVQMRNKAQQLSM